MEKLFNMVMERIATTMPELSLIDEDYGQLEGSEDGYPVTFPCVLISAPSISWGSACTGLQEGQGTITVKLAIDCYDDTHYGSTTEQKIETRLLLNKKLVSTLQFFRNGSGMSPLIRTLSRNYSQYGGIKIYETNFKFTIRETIDITNSQKV